MLVFTHLNISVWDLHYVLTSLRTSDNEPIEGGYSDDSGLEAGTSSNLKTICSYIISLQLP